MLLTGSLRPVPVQNAKRWIFCRYADTWCSDSSGWVGTPAGNLSFISLKKTLGMRLSANTTPLSAIRWPVWLAGNLLNATNLHITEKWVTWRFSVCKVVYNAICNTEVMHCHIRYKRYKWWIRTSKEKCSYLRDYPQLLVNNGWKVLNLHFKTVLLWYWPWTLIMSPPVLGW
jgi:hypothetical protein